MGGSGPPMMNAGYNSNYQIVQGPGYVMILIEMIHDVRIIPLDGRPQPPRNIRQWMGSLARPMGGQHARRRDDELQRQERVPGRQRESAGDRTVHPRRRRRDRLPVHGRRSARRGIRPWTAEVPMEKTEGPIFEFACHEGNYGLANILAGARAEEKQRRRSRARRERNEHATRTELAVAFAGRLLWPRRRRGRTTRSRRSST